MPPVTIQGRDSAVKVADLGMTIFYSRKRPTTITKMLKRGAKLRQDTCTWPMRTVGSVVPAAMMDDEDKTEYGGPGLGKGQMCIERVGSPGWKVGRIAQLQDIAGIKDNVKDAIGNDALDLAEAIEMVITSDQEARLESGAATPGLTRGMARYLQTAEQSVYPVPEAFRPVTACNVSTTLAEYHPEDMEDQLLAMAEQGKSPVDLVLLAGLKLASRVGKWPQHVAAADGSRGGTYTFNANNGKVISMIVTDLEFNAGKVHLVPVMTLLRDLATGEDTAKTSRSGMFVKPDNWSIRWADEPGAWRNPDLGGGPRGFHDGVFALICHQPVGQGTVTCES